MRVDGGSVLCGVPPLARRLAAAPSPLRPAQGWTLAFSRSASGIRPGRPRSSRASAIVNAVGMGERFDSIAWRHEMWRKRGGRERRPRGAPGMAIYLLAARRAERPAARTLRTGYCEARGRAFSMVDRRETELKNHFDGEQ